MSAMPWWLKGRCWDDHDGHHADGAFINVLRGSAGFVIKHHGIEDL